MRRPAHLAPAQQDSLCPKDAASLDSFDEETGNLSPFLLFLIETGRGVIVFLSVAVFVVGCWAVLEAIR